MNDFTPDQIDGIKINVERKLSTTGYDVTFSVGRMYKIKSITYECIDNDYPVGKFVLENFKDAKDKLEAHDN